MSADYAAIAERAQCSSGCGTPRECVCTYLADAASELARLSALNARLVEAVRCLGGDEAWWESEGVSRHEGTGKSSAEIRREVYEEALSSAREPT